MIYRPKRRLSSVGSFVLAAALVLVATSILVSGCGKKEPEAKEIIRPVKMMTIGAGTREYPGIVRAAEEIQLSFEVPGRHRRGQRLPDRSHAGGTGGGTIHVFRI